MSEKEQIIRRNKEEVRKAVGAIHTSGNLSLLERKMVNVLLLNAYDDLLQHKTHRLPVAYLSEMLGWEESQNTALLKAVLTKLASTAIEFNILNEKSKKKGASSWKVMSFISFGEIENGICSYRYDEYLEERLFDPEIYATINIGVQKKFAGSYSLNLYENCLRYKRVGSTGWWDLERFRKLVGADKEFHNEFKYLKRDVIAPAVAEINRVSNIMIEAEYRKTGRSISEIRFVVKEHPQQQLFKAAAVGENEKIRESEVFAILREHGVGERLAIAWILEKGEERVMDVVAYVEGKEQKKLIKGSTAGYIRRVIEDDGALPVDRERARRAKAQANEDRDAKLKAAELQKEAVEREWKSMANAALAALSPETLEDYFEQFKGETPRPAMLIRSGVRSEAFRAWLRPRLVPKDGLPH